MQSVINRYKQLESKVDMLFHIDHVTYDSPVNFNESLATPRHRWFPYKEGFSPSFVRSFFDDHVHKKNANILDPFCGVGTTVLEAALQGHNGYGIEVNPLTILIAEAKTSFLSSDAINEFHSLICDFADSELKIIADEPENDTVISYYEPDFLESLLRVKAFIHSIENPVYKKLFRTAFLSVVETFSTHRRAGNGVKKKRRLDYEELSGSSPIEKVRIEITSHLETYLEDMSVMHPPNQLGNVTFIQDNVLQTDFLSEELMMDALLTSPPYANCFDYSKIYMRELWIGDFFTSRQSQQDFRMNSVRSHVHATWPERYEAMGSKTMSEIIYPLVDEQDLWSKKIPSMLRGYFRDLGKLLSKLKPILRENAPLGFVVGNSVYGGIPIATDLLLSETAEQYGYETERIEVFRYVVPSSQQYVQLEDKEYIRESMVVLRNR